MAADNLEWLPPVPAIPAETEEARGRSEQPTADGLAAIVSPQRRPSVRAASLSLVDRVQEAESSGGKRRLDRFTQQLSQIINSLASQGKLVQTSPGKWEILGAGGVSATVAPNAFDDSRLGFAPGALWVVGSSVYICLDATPGAAVWMLVGSGSGITFPGDATKFLDGTGAFTVPPGTTAPVVPGYRNLTMPPDSSAWTFFNQNGASLVDNPDSLSLIGPGLGSGGNLTGVTIAAPTPPYTITAAMLSTTFIGKAFQGFGLCWTDGTKIHAFHSTFDNELDSTKYDDANTFNAHYSSVGGCSRCPIWLQIADDGFARITRYSFDGYVFAHFNQISRTDFLTATRVGFFVNRENQNTPNLDVNATLYSWLQT